MYTKRNNLLQNRLQGFLIGLLGGGQLFCSVYLLSFGLSLCIYQSQPVGAVLGAVAMILGIQGVMSCCLGLLWILSPDWDPTLRKRFLTSVLPLWRFDR